ncbi:MAG: PEP-CTERM sorting domain-containing protein [Sedimentisphaerales bacterium]|nr:PEP-CTERM sorting domain-containing protein [Sedimentisphaerales bacterium]
MLKGTRSLILAGVVVLLISVPSWGAYVRSIQAVFDYALFYDYDPVTYSPNIGTFQMNGGVPIAVGEGHIKVAGAADFDYNLIDCTMTFGNQSQINLAGDTSAGGWAHGTFSAGQTIVLSGKIEVKSSGITIFDSAVDGSILETYVTDPFMVDELSWDALVAHQKLEVTGGELLTGAKTGLIIMDPTDFVSDYEALFCTQGVPPFVDNFKDDIYNGDSMQLHFTAEVPEPATLMLIGLGSLCVMRRKK